MANYLMTNTLQYFARMFECRQLLPTSKYDIGGNSASNKKKNLNPTIQAIVDCYENMSHMMFGRPYLLHYRSDWDAISELVLCDSNQYKHQFDNNLRW